MKEFSLEDEEFIALCDLLKVVDLCSNGAEAKNEIASGKVQVDGVIETRKRCKIRNGQTVQFKGQQVKVVS